MKSDFTIFRTKVLEIDANSTLEGTIHSCQPQIINISIWSSSGNAGCNEFNGDNVVNETQITFDLLSSTKRPCEAPNGLHEGAVLAVFQNTATFELDENVLTITSEDGSSVIVLELNN